MNGCVSSPGQASLAHFRLLAHPPETTCPCPFSRRCGAGCVACIVNVRVEKLSEWWGTGDSPLVIMPSTQQLLILRTVTSLDNSRHLWVFNKSDRSIHYRWENKCFERIYYLRANLFNPKAAIRRRAVRAIFDPQGTLNAIFRNCF